MGLHKEFTSGLRPPNVHIKSSDSIDFWTEQKKRCIDGYIYAGLRLTADHYFFLNFMTMDITDRYGNVTFAKPAYSKEDEKLFKLLEEAEGMNRGFMFVTGRGYGKSYITASLCARRYTFFKHSHSVISASYEKPAKDLFEKVNLALYAMPAGALRHNRLNNNNTLIESGVKYKDEYDVESVKGYQSKVERVIFENSPGKTRGTRPTLHIYEEIGAWTGAAKLIDCYNMSIGSYYRGSVKTGFPVLIGTGGQMMSGGSVDASVMFRNPKEFELMAFTQDQLSKPTCYFIPAYDKYHGFWEIQGPVLKPKLDPVTDNPIKDAGGKVVEEEVGFVPEAGTSDTVGARAYLEKKREEKKENVKAFNQLMQEYPFNAQEAFMISGVNMFDTRRLYKHLSNLQTRREMAAVMKIGRLDFTYAPGGNILGVTWEEDPENGDFMITEHPMRDSFGHVYDDLYISGCDSYDADAGVSLGSIFVKKRFLSAQVTHNLYVAQYTGRPGKADDFYEATLKLNLYYNARMMVEHTKIAIIKWYQIEHKGRYYDLLMNRPSVCYADITKSRAGNEKGVQMPEQIKTYGIKRINTYLKTYTESIYFPDLLENLIQFDPEESTKYDRVMAMMMVEIADTELTEVDASESKEAKKKTKKMGWRTVNGRKVWTEMAA